MAINVSVNVGTQLQQTLTPQQIQYLKLLQMPLLEFEEEVKRQIEENPLLEIDENSPSSQDNEAEQAEGEEIIEDEFGEAPIYDTDENEANNETKDEEITYFNDYNAQDEIPLSIYNPDVDEKPDEFYKMILQDDAEYIPNPKSS